MKLSLINFNTLGTPLFAPHITKRYQALTKRLLITDATIICLQEVATYYHLFLLKKALKKGYPYLCYQPFFYGPKGGVVIFSQVPLTNCSYQSFHSLGQFTNISFYSKLLRNGLLHCQIAGKDLTIITTHLLCDFSFDESSPNKLHQQVVNQVDEVITNINYLKKTHKNIILCGNFNVVKNSLLYKRIMQKTNLLDVFKDIDTPTYFPDRIPFAFKAEKPLQIDHCFYYSHSQTIKILSQNLIFEKKEQLSPKEKGVLSDHLGLQITFQI